MSEVIIRTESLGKLYKLGEIGTGTISHDLNRWWAKLRGRQDPYLKIDQSNADTLSRDWVWALRDINFDVQQGQVLGIIGRNGAGKSTLLKLLSKVTSPTEGKIKIRGRIASLLEVGTGFHQELTGRENIFLNGSILGMTKAEIRKKFDEIVDFAGVERFIDTPVKRYSSGMYVRLAFSVAAFLEPEILIIDEVLAVGDAEFQNKCLGRMKDVNLKDGRTVLFVSHNMQAVNQLCTNGIFLEAGRIAYEGSISNCIQKYFAKAKISELDLLEGKNRSEFLKPEVTYIKLENELTEKDHLKVTVQFRSPFKINAPAVGIVISDEFGHPVCGTNNRMHAENYKATSCSSGKMQVVISNLKLLSGTYYVSVFLGDSLVDYASYPDILGFDLLNNSIENTQIPSSKFIGSMHLDHVNWTLEPFE